MKIPKITKMKTGGYRCQLRLGGVSYVINGVSEQDCKRKAVQAKNNYDVSVVAHKETISYAIDQYIKDRCSVLSPLTIRGYRIIQQSRFQFIMDKRFQDISNWQEVVNKESRLCSPKTLSNSFSFIRSVAKSLHIVIPNVTLPLTVPNTRNFLDADEIAIFVDKIKETKYAIPALLGLSSLRISEICALEWKDVHDDFVYVHCSQVLDEHNNKVYKSVNKNYSSTRNVPIFIPQLKELLKNKGTGLVYKGGQNSLRDFLKKFCMENDLPIVTPHGLRHSFASLAYSLKIPQRITMEIGGWADSTTMDKIYTHIARKDVTHYGTELNNFFKNCL